MRPKVKKEIDWDRVFELRCKSKRGEAMHSLEMEFLRNAWKADPVRYSSLGKEIEETHPAAPLARKK